MEGDHIKPEELENVRGMQLGDRQSYLSNTLEELENAQIDDDQLNFPVPDNIEEHIKQQRKEASEMMERAAKSTSKKHENVSASEESKTQSDSNESVVEEAPVEKNPQPDKEKQQVPRSPSWSNFNSPDHTEINQNRASKHATLSPIVEESSKISPSQKANKPSIKANFGYKRNEPIHGNAVYRPLQRESINEYGSNLSNPNVIKDKNLKNSKKEDLLDTLNREEAAVSATKGEVQKKRNLKGSNPTSKKELQEISKADSPYSTHYWDDGSFGEYYDEESETSEYIKSSDQLVNSINHSFSTANLYPSDDHVDHLFYLHNSEGMTERDVYFYTLGVSKERSVSFAKKSMDMMTKLEGLLSLANKNLTTTTTNLKITENNITSLRTLKKAATLSSEVDKKQEITEGKLKADNIHKSRILSREDKAKDKIEFVNHEGTRITNPIARKPEQVFIVKNPGPIKIQEPSEVEQDRSGKATIKPSGARNQSEESRKELSNQDLTGDKIAQKIASFHAVNISDSLLEKEEILEKLLPMMTDKLMENVMKGNDKYRETVKRVLIENLKKQIQKEKGEGMKD